MSLIHVFSHLLTSSPLPLQTSTLSLAATANVYPVQWDGSGQSQNGFTGGPLALTAQPQFGDAVAIRVPLLHMASFNDGEEGEHQLFAIMVLMLPGNSARRCAGIRSLYIKLLVLFSFTVVLRLGL